MYYLSEEFAACGGGGKSTSSRARESQPCLLGCQWELHGVHCKGQKASKAHDFINEFNAIERVREAGSSPTRCSVNISLSLSLLTALLIVCVLNACICWVGFCFVHTKPPHLT